MGSWRCSCYEEVEKLIANYLPNYIFHIAANSTTRHNALFDNHQIIATGTLNVLEAAKNYCPEAKVFITGSGLQFKNKGKPISEKDEFEANNTYSIARIHSVYAARYYRSLGLKIYVGYLFHHESPLRKENYVSQTIARAVKRIAEGSEEKIEIGDISVEKEWTFAGDVVEGIFTLMQQENIFEAAIGSGISYSIVDWLDECFKIIDRDWRNYVKLREGFTPEYKHLISAPKTINSLGWLPKVNLGNLARMMVLESEVL